MDMQTGKILSIDSLLSFSIDFIMQNLQFYQKTYMEFFFMLPPNIKNRMLEKYTRLRKVSENTSLNSFLEALMNQTISIINLSSFVLNDEILNILGTCSNWKHLELTRNEDTSGISSIGLMNLFEKCSKLQNLILTNCSAMTDQVLKCITEHCSNLQGIDIGGCMNITDKGIESLAEMKIKWLRISGTQVTDEGITKLVNGQCGMTLTELILDNCINITHVGIHNVIECCPDLSILTFLNCGRDIFNNDLVTFKKPLKQISWQIPF